MIVISRTMGAEKMAQYSDLMKTGEDSAIRGQRGQRFLRGLLAAIDAMPVKRLIADDLVTPSAEVCAIAEIRAWRLARNLTQAQAAALVGLPTQRWSEFETGARRMRETVRLLLVALDMIDHLTGALAALGQVAGDNSYGVGAAAPAPQHWYDRLVSQVDGDGTAAVIPEGPGFSRRMR